VALRSRPAEGGAKPPAGTCQSGRGPLGDAVGQAAFIAAAPGGLDAWGVRTICRRIAVAAYAALADGAGMTARRPGALERAFSVLASDRLPADVFMTNP
jgi:hypothetical protein